MKKIVISIVCLLALAAGVSSYAYYRSHLVVAKNSLAKANVEALTEGENQEKGYSSTHWICWKVVNYGGIVTTIDSGKRSASCWENPNSTKACHSHTCSDCISEPW